MCEIVCRRCMGGGPRGDEDLVVHRVRVRRGGAASTYAPPAKDAGVTSRPLLDPSLTVTSDMQMRRLLPSVATGGKREAHGEAAPAAPASPNESISYGTNRSAKHPAAANRNAGSLSVDYSGEVAALGARKNIVLVNLNSPQDVVKVLRHRDHKVDVGANVQWNCTASQNDYLASTCGGPVPPRRPIFEPCLPHWPLLRRERALTPAHVCPSPLQLRPGHLHLAGRVLQPHHRAVQPQTLSQFTVLEPVRRSAVGRHLLRRHVHTHLGHPLAAATEHELLRLDCWRHADQVEPVG